MSMGSLSIYVIGPSSTGKTTLCAALAKKLALPENAYVTEVARNVMKEKGYSRDTIGSVQMQKDIMDAHFQREMELDEVDDCPIRLFDRSAIDPIVYAILTSKSPEEAQARQRFLVQTANFQKALERYRRSTSIIILLNPVPQWVFDDGIRSIENQDRCLDIFRKLLLELGLEYHQFGSEVMFLQERVIITMGLARL